MLKSWGLGGKYVGTREVKAALECDLKVMLHKFLVTYTTFNPALVAVSAR